MSVIGDLRDLWVPDERPVADEARAADYRERLKRLHQAMGPMMDEVNAAWEAGYSTPFLNEGALILSDRKFRERPQ